jgi:hypothetical protein
MEDVAALDRLAVFRSDTESHGGGNEEAVLAALLECDSHMG